MSKIFKEENPADVDLIIVATMSPDAYTPATAAQRLGRNPCPS
ncbi:hypothetical protein [uncultured Lactobacillus sp.]|nr:hypothetical protein [uncultured Lactobacillus sp.]